MKEFLSKKNIQYKERNILFDKNAMSELEKMGINSTPVILINGETVIGFNQSKLEQLLGS